MPHPCILLVSVDPDFAAIYGAMLRHAGHLVILVTDPDRAVETAAATQPDVVLVDLPTPTSSGAGVTESLHADDRTARLRVLAITARVTERELVRARRAGAMKVLAMPIPPQMVVTEVEAALATT